MNVKKKKKILCSFETRILTYDTRKKEITRKKYFIYLLEEQTFANTVANLLD